MTPAPKASRIGEIRRAFPLEFDPAVYRHVNAHLRYLDDAALASHFHATGKHQGLRANSLATRHDFAALAAGEPDLLEIAINASTSLAIAHDQVIAPDDLPGLDPAAQARTTILSSHIIQSETDLIAHLRAVEDLLAPGGVYLLVIPDHRYGC
ncbi:MAG: hypothetical protein ACR2J8_06640, partial [Thermomicrobiales bacterium]